jgi:hypothetical protein
MSIPFLILRVASNGGITWNGEAIAEMPSKMGVKFRCGRLRGSGAEDFLFLDERLSTKMAEKVGAYGTGSKTVSCRFRSYHASETNSEYQSDTGFRKNWDTAKYAAIAKEKVSSLSQMISLC